MTNQQRKTIVVLVLDETGSMNQVRDETIQGVNQYLETLKKDNSQDDTLFTLTLFNSKEIRTPYNGVSLNDVAPITRDTYKPDEWTPLYDAVGKAIRSTEALEIRQIPAPNVILAVMTDGLENASREYTNTQIITTITEKQTKGWTFVFLGANQDSWKTAGSIGVPTANAGNYNYKNPGDAFKSLSSVTASYRTTARKSTSKLQTQQVEWDADKNSLV